MFDSTKTSQNHILARLERALMSATKCAICHQNSHDTPVCDVCLTDWAALRRDHKTHCPMCAAHSSGGILCGSCQQKPLPQKHTAAAYRYAAPLDALIQAYKFQQHHHLYAALAHLMLQNRPQWLPEASSFNAILAMPLSRQRLNQRGFNQSHLLAQALAKDLNLPLMPPSVVKRRHRPPQSRLSTAAERWQNVRGAFHIRLPEAIIGQHLLLIDDVMTTGATLHELAQILCQSGAASVSAWVLAKGD